MSAVHPRAANFTIASGSTQSNLVAIPLLTSAAFKVPSMTGTAINILGAARRGDTPTQITYDSPSSDLSFAVPTPGEWFSLTGNVLDAIKALPFIALLSNASEGATRTIVMVGKPG